MKRSLHNQRTTALKLLAVLILCSVLLLPGISQGGELCGMDLSLYADQTAPPDLQYALGSPIKVILVIKNVSGFTAATERWFSQVDLYKSLIVMDPAGKHYKYSEATKAVDMPPPFFLAGQPAIPAEVLQSGWARTITLEDLRELFPMMKTDPGWYTLEANVPFIKFGWTVQDRALGVLGILGHRDQCEGFIASNRLNLYISPEFGAQLQVQVLEKSSGAPKPVTQVPVKVFSGNVPASELADTWAKGVPVLAGSTNLEGYAVWGGGAACKTKGEYTAIGYHRNTYRAAGFNESDPWGPGCGATIPKQMVFGERLALSQFSVFASKSIWVMAKAIVRSGHIGVRNSSPGLWLDSGVEIAIGAGARAEEGVKIFGDSIRLLPHSSVDDVYYNQLKSHGTIRGESVTPLSVPLPVDLPFFPEIAPGSKDISVKDGATTILAPGNYGTVKIGKNGTLKLSGGIYHFKALTLSAKSSLQCLAPSEVRIKKRASSGPEAYIGPLKTSTTLKARDVTFYVQGPNGKDTDLLSLPAAVEIGEENTVKANVIAPNGTLKIQPKSELTGSFMGKGVIIGVGSTVHLDSAF